MPIKLIRKSTFETNSSSCHSITLNESDTTLSQTLSSEGDLIEVPIMEFGWEREEYYDSLSKLAYVCIYVRDWCDVDSLRFEQILRDVVRDHTGLEINFDFKSDDTLSSGFIDHQSVEARDLDYLFSNQGHLLRNFLFSNQAVLTTDNDNH